MAFKNVQQQQRVITNSVHRVTNVFIKNILLSVRKQFVITERLHFGWCYVYTTVDMNFPISNIFEFSI